MLTGIMHLGTAYTVIIAKSEPNKEGGFWYTRTSRDIVVGAATPSSEKCHSAIFMELFPIEISFRDGRDWSCTFRILTHLKSPEKAINTYTWQWGIYFPCSSNNILPMLIIFEKHLKLVEFSKWWLTSWTWLCPKCNFPGIYFTSVRW